MYEFDLSKPGADAFVIRAEQASDVAAREALLDVCFGTNRHMRTCQRLRDGRMPAAGLAFIATRGGRVIGTLRLWNTNAGSVPALVLGPLAVEENSRAFGVGAALMRHAIDAACAQRYRAIVLLGDAPYYARFGFSADKAANLALPGPFERGRLLGLELEMGSLDGARVLSSPPAPRLTWRPDALRLDLSAGTRHCEPDVTKVQPCPAV